MKTIRTASGLGDSMYLIPPIKYLSKTGESFGVLTHWKEVYNGVAQPMAYDRHCRVDIDATYVDRRSVTETNQFEDVCIKSGINERVELEHTWNIKPGQQVVGYRKSDKPLCLIRWPYYREGKGQLKNGDLVPPPNLMQAIVDKYKNDYHFVNIGNGVDKTVEIQGVTDLTGKTTLTDILFLVSQSEMIITQCGMMLPGLFVQTKVYINGNVHEAKVPFSESPRNGIDAAQMREYMDWAINTCAQMLGITVQQLMIASKKLRDGVHE